MGSYRNRHSSTTKRLALLLLSTIALLVSCTAPQTKTDTPDIEYPTLKEYKQAMATLELTDDYNLLDLRAAVGQYANSYLQSKDIDTLTASANYLKPYSTSVIYQNLCLGSWEQNDQYSTSLKEILYSSSKNTSNNQAKFLIVYNKVYLNSNVETKYIELSISDTGKINQIERW